MIHPADPPIEPPARAAPWGAAAGPLVVAGAAGTAARVQAAPGAAVERAAAEPGATRAERGRALARLAAGGALLVGSRASALARLGLSVDDEAFVAVLGLAELAAWWLPGRYAARPARALAELLGPDARSWDEADADALAAGAARLVARAAAEPPLARGLAARCHAAALPGLDRDTPGAASDLRAALALLDAPSRLLAGGGDLFDASSLPDDGWLAEAARACPVVELALDELDPECARPSEFDEVESLPPQRAETRPLGADDRRRVDEVFEGHLPQLAGDGLEHRPSQALVAREVAASLGAGELLLVHAPTGTGKTLAYLVPALLFALRNDLRFGVATYTRALQTQAMERDVPLALELLRRAGLEDVPRVSVLKGRANYVCWRALGAEAPTEADSAERWLAFARVALFALQDPTSDLDGLPRGGALPGAEPRGLRRAVERLVDASRARTACCTRPEDRAVCAAELARRRAERSHLVITNHAFALTRPEFLRNLVFDECEHLHDQAGSAFSRAVRLDEARDLLDRVAKPGATARSRRPLDQVRRAAVPGTEAAFEADRAREAALEVARRLGGLEREAEAFLDWRRARLAERDERDAHSLLREYALSDDAAALLDNHVELLRAFARLESGLAALSEHLDTAAIRARRRVRFALDRLRIELGELRSSLNAWLPIEDGAPRHADDFFYDVERAPRGALVLEARVLLPNEVLGRHYYPDLDGAVLLSATTVLKGSFAAARGYLGVDRACEPDLDEEREPCVAREVAAPESFDYGRVLVAAPTDAPGYGAGKGAFLDYVARFVGHVAERTRGRMLVLLTNAEDCRAVGRRLEPFLAERGVACLWQGMPGRGKEELAAAFRAHPEAVLLGLDTFWFGADFPGRTLEHLVLPKLPYGVPDRYHHAQCAALGSGEQRKRIYMPRALAKFRQGFGRLLRTRDDRGCVYLLDKRALDPRHRVFLRELPLAADGEGGARFVRGETDRCVQEALAHSRLQSEVARAGLAASFADTRLGAAAEPPPEPGAEAPF